MPDITLGDKVPESAVRKTSVYNQEIVNTYILISPSQFLDEYIWDYQNIQYRLGVDKEGCIQFISTANMNIETSEGIRVGDTLEGAKKRYDLTIVKWTGWGYVGILPSGWCIAFFIPPTMTERALNNNDKVGLIFKCKYVEDGGKP